MFFNTGAVGLCPRFNFWESFVAMSIFLGEHPPLLTLVVVHKQLRSLTILQTGAALRTARGPVAEHRAHAGVATLDYLFPLHALDNFYSIGMNNFTEFIFFENRGAAMPAGRARELIALLWKIFFQTLLAFLRSIVKTRSLAVFFLCFERELLTRLRTGSVR